jgi:tRNA(adenine34) deaminase
MRMLNFYINRAGKNLSQGRIATLERAKKLLSGIIAKSKESKEKTPAKKAAKKLATKKATKQATKKKAAPRKSPSR